MFQSKPKVTFKKIKKVPEFLEERKVKLIYNPQAGKKRRILRPNESISLEDIDNTLRQYQIIADFYPTKSPGHATELARAAKKEGYELVLVAGGDGTVGEVANGLIDSEVKLGIIPLGTVMNIARMLSIPNELEKAVQIIKIGRDRRIDVGSIVKLEGEKLDEPQIFLESVGIGLEAQLQQHIHNLEKGDVKASFRMFKALFEYYNHRAELVIDDEKIKTRATLVSISNGPVAAAALPLAPDAKLNDHMLTVTIYDMTKMELAKHFWQIFRGGDGVYKKIRSFKGKRVKIFTKNPRLIHADARLFGETPVELKVIPNALSVICGFPKEGQSALIKRTYLDP